MIIPLVDLPIIIVHLPIIIIPLSSHFMITIVPIGSMYGLYGNIYQYTPNASINLPLTWIRHGVYHPMYYWLVVGPPL